LFLLVKALRVNRTGARHVNCFALKKRVPLKGVITGVAVNVKVDQLMGKIPSVCDARHLVRRSQGGVIGQTEESLPFLLSFDVESLPNKWLLVILYEVLCQMHFIFFILPLFN
jgi:hypothetical protein